MAYLRFVGRRLHSPSEMPNPGPARSLHPNIAVITASRGHPALGKCIASVAAQHGVRPRHYLFVDGREHVSKVRGRLARVEHSAEIIVLPDTTGTGGFNGHRIYGAAPFLVNADLVAFLDEDNFLDPEHFAALVAVIQNHGLDWAYSLRNIVDPRGRFVCRDDCDSLGLWGSWYGAQSHIDTSCYLLKRELAIEVSAIWNRPAYSDSCVDPDKALCRWLIGNRIKGFTSGEYTVNYRLGGSAQSATAAYFKSGNRVMRATYKHFPWRRPLLEEINSRRDYRRIIGPFDPYRASFLRRVQSRMAGEGRRSRADA